MRRMRWGGLCCLGLWLGLIPMAYAVTRTFTWNAPLTNTDGTPATSITGYTIYRSTNNGTTFTKLTPNVSGTTLTWMDAAVPTGDVCYEVTAFNAQGESIRSNRVCFSMPGAVPNAPTALSVSGSVAPVSTPRKGHK